MIDKLKLRILGFCWGKMRKKFACAAKRAKPLWQRELWHGKRFLAPLIMLKSNGLDHSILTFLAPHSSNVKLSDGEQVLSKVEGRVEPFAVVHC